MSSSSFSLVELFDSICRNYGEYDAVVRSDSPSICYLEIQQASNRLADQLFYRFGRPNMVLLDLNRAAAAELAAVVACLRLGIVFVPVDGTDPFRLQQTVDHLQIQGTPTIAAIVLAVNDADPRLSSFFHANIHFCLLVDASGDMVEPISVPTLPSTKTPTDEDDMYILFTSGTTEDAEMKAVIGSRSQTLRRLYWFADEIQRQEKSVTTVIARRTPLTFIDGVHELLSVLLTTHDDHTPGKFYCSEHLHDLVLHSTRITMLPSQLGQVLSIALNSSLEQVVVSGEPCPPTILEKFKAAKSRGDFPETVRLYNFYGQTETVGDVCFASLLDERDPILVRDTVSVGRPLPGVSLRLDEDTNEVIVTAGSFANGYYSKRDESSLCPFRTGDVGFYEGGCLFIRGRVGDVQKVNGVLTSPTDIESRFLQVFGDNCSCAAVIQHGLPYVLVACGTMREDFSREKMMKEQVPWHLIPRKMFFTSNPLPKTTTGKIYRKRVQSIVAQRLMCDEDSNETAKPPLESDPLREAMASILRRPPTAEELKVTSFIELGGDSHMAVALWHKLKANGLLTDQTILTPIDLLEAGTVEDIRLLVTQGVCSKKRRKAPLKFARHKVTKLVTMSDTHVYSQFDGCVDAAPVYEKGFVYGACQSGTIQRFSLTLEGDRNKHPVESISMDGGWRIQATLTPIEGGIIACCHHLSDDSGLVVCVARDLGRIIWKRQICGGIKATPVVRHNHVLVQGGKTLYVLETPSGSIVAQHLLNGPSESSPAAVANDKLYLYTCSDWGCDFQVVDLQHLQSITSDSILNRGGAPIHVDPLVISPNRVVTADALGFVHDINTSARSVKSFKISNTAFSGAPVKASDGHVILGGQDGIVRCLHEANLSHVLWTVDLGASIRCKVLPIQETEYVVCTTAGNVFLVSTANNPNFRKVGQVTGEIWSDALRITGPPPKEGIHGTSIAFGARDSRIHVITFH